MRNNKAIKSGELARNEKLLATMKYCKENNKPLHLLGLVSNGGVHSHINHLKALCDIADTYGLAREQVFIHAFTDGRDCDPNSGIEFLKQLQQHLYWQKEYTS